MREPMCVIRIATAAGVTPLIRDAWPTERGRIASSFSTTSFESPGMSRYTIPSGTFTLSAFASFAASTSWRRR